MTRGVSIGLSLFVTGVLLVGTASGQDVRAGVEQLASQIVKRAPQGRQLRVAVADFPDLQGATTDLGRYIANRLTTRLAESPTFLVIERQRLGQVLAELRFSMSDLVDPAKAKQLGRMAGVEAIVVGTVSDLGNQVDLDARLIEIETNRMLLGAATTISRDQVVDDMLKRGRATSQISSAPHASSGTPGVQPSPPQPSPPQQSTVSLAGFTFEPRGCRQHSTFYCVVAVTNTTDASRSVYFHGMSLVDDRGNEHGAQVYIGAETLPLGGYTFVPRLTINVRLHTRGVVDSGATSMNAVVNMSGLPEAVIVRGISIAK